MKSFESKFCKWSGWDNADTAAFQFYVTEWTDYSKTLIEKGGGEIENYTCFMFNAEEGKIYFLSEDGEEDISYIVELFVV